MKYIAAALLFCFAIMLISAPVWLASDLRTLRCGGPHDPFNTCKVTK